ncbi:MAG: RNA polymerase sigma factor [Nannocystales bacterium]
MTVRSDESLLAEWSRGDQAAGEVLVARHFPTVYRFFHNKVGHAVHDLCQRTFVACLEAKDRFEGRSSFRTFLLGIANYQLLRYLRTARRNEAKRLDAQRHSVAEFLERAPTSPTERLAKHAEHGVLLRALRRLPLAMQLVLELRYWEELTVAEIAEVLEVPLGTISSRLGRARTSLRKTIEAHESTALAETTLRGLERWAAEIAALADRSGS